jgi:hypothetical protein
VESTGEFEVARAERVGFTARRDGRSFERINGLVAVHDRADGTYEARHVAVQQFAILVGTSGVALQFRFFDPSDVDTVFAQAAAIAATWRITTTPLGPDDRDLLRLAVRDPIREDLGRLRAERRQHVDLRWPARLGHVRMRRLGLGYGMAVVDADQIAVGVVARSERGAELRRIYLVSRLGRRMDVPPAHQAIRHLAIAEQQTAALVRC